MTDPQPSVLLNTGTLMPLLGLGTFRLQSQEDSYNAVGAALTAGYHVFDTAAICHNEAQLGHALRRLLPKHDLSQEDVYITTGSQRSGVQSHRWLSEEPGAVGIELH